MLSFNVCHFHFKVNFQVTVVNPEWQCSMLCKVGTGSETAKGIFKTACDASWHVWNFLLHLLRIPSWVSLSFAKNFWILSHVLHHYNWSETRKLLSKFCTFFNSNVLGWLFCFVVVVLWGFFVLLLEVFWWFFWFFVLFFSKEALANAKTDELFFLNSSHHCKTHWRIMSVKAFHHFLRQSNCSKSESSDVWSYNFYWYDIISFIMTFLVKVRSWWNLAFWLHLSHEKVNRGGKNNVVDNVFLDFKL